MDHGRLFWPEVNLQKAFLGNCKGIFGIFGKYVWEILKLNSSLKMNSKVKSGTIICLHL